MLKLLKPILSVYARVLVPPNLYIHTYIYIHTDTHTVIIRNILGGTKQTALRG